MRRIFFILALLLPALSACGTFDEWQREKVYRPIRIVGDYGLAALRAQYPQVQLQQIDEAPGGQLQVLLVPPRGDSGAVPQHPEIRVLYLHGTGANAWQNMAKIEGITRNGLEVAAPDYRGWGASSPLLPSEESIHADAWAAWLALQAPAGQGQGVRWVIYGHSMGSAVAVRLAQRLKEVKPKAYCALVLESSFTSFPDIARSTGTLAGPLLSGLSSQKMASIERIADVHGPLWMLHGTQDTTVPIELGRRLYDAAPGPKTWLELPLAHSNLQTDTSGQYDALWQSVKAACSR